MRWQEGRDGQGEPYLLDDPLASTTRRLVEGAASPADKVAALLGLGAVFPAPLAANPAFRAALTRQAERLWRRGPLEAIAAFAAEAGRPPA